MDLALVACSEPRAALDIVLFTQAPLPLWRSSIAPPLLPVLPIPPLGLSAPCRRTRWPHSVAKLSKNRRADRAVRLGD